MKANLDPGLHIRRPAPLLESVVEQYWVGVENRDDGYDIVPDGCVDVVLHVRGTRAALWAYGTSTRLRREAIEPGHYLGIRFRPGMARHFLDVDASVLTNRREAITREFRIDPMALVDTIESPELFRHLDRLLQQHIARVQPAVSGLDASIRKIAMHGNVMGVEAMARNLGKSRRQFERDFLRAVGVSAREFGVISRFRRASGHMASTPAAPLADIAACAGYADQSHMTRDFQHLAGTSPARWKRDVAIVQDA